MTALPPLDQLGDAHEDQGEVTAPEEQAAAPTAPGSLQDRLHQRRAALQAQESRDFDVPGYEGVIIARYHMLPWKTHRSITARNERERDASTREVYTAADTLINACDDLLEVQPDGTHRPLGYKWGVRAAQELFGVADAETARQAVLACFPRDALLMAHYGALMQWQQGQAPEVDEALAGESEASSAGT